MPHVCDLITYEHEGQMPKRSERKLTKRTVDALGVEAGDALFWDRELAGFGVRVHAAGRKSYVVQSRGPGGPVRVTLGRHGEMSCDEARKQAAGVIDRIKRGEDPRAGPAAELTLSRLSERFMRAHVRNHCKPATAAGYRALLDKHILPGLGEEAVVRIGRAEVRALHHRLRGMPARANAAVALLSQMFALAEAWELLPPGRNPCRGLRRYRTRKRERFLSEAEYRRLGDALDEAEEGGAWGPAIAAIRLLALTGCRRDEILRLRWDDVDRTAGELRLEDAKTGPRMVPLTTPVRGILEKIPRRPGVPWVFTGRGGGRLSNLYAYWDGVRRRAGLGDVRLHDLRHSYASRALALGESLPAIGKLLGHVKVSTTARYAHLMRDAERAAAARVGGSIGVHVKSRGS